MKSVILSVDRRGWADPALAAAAGAGHMARRRAVAAAAGSSGRAEHAEASARRRGARHHFGRAGRSRGRAGHCRSDAGAQAGAELKIPGNLQKTDPKEKISLAKRRGLML